MVMKKVLFIDRDGTLIKEAPPTYQVDAFSKLEFYPHVFQYMRKIAAKFSYELVMVSNQDGLGTDIFPEDTFWPVHNFVLKAFENEGVHFKNILIDRSFIAENNPNRKPGIGMLSAYFNKEEYDIKNSFVIGDRITDMQFALNIGCKGIWLKNNEALGATEIKDPAALKKVIALETKEWEDVYKYLKNENVQI
jgi:imidazoleglycerol-phosphate dehydratase/histidinol-phosphatase